MAGGGGFFVNGVSLEIDIVAGDSGATQLCQNSTSQYKTRQVNSRRHVGGTPTTQEITQAVIAEMGAIG
jgi:hypothetical protein